MRTKGVFRGWYIVLGCFILMSMNYGSRYCFGVFMKPMAGEFSWSISTVSLAASIYLLVYALAAIAVGRSLDRAGPRWLVLAGSIAAAAGFVLGACATTPIELYLAYGILFGLGSAATGVVVCNPYVGRWFVRKRGLALGISSMGVGFGTVILSPVAGYIVKYYTWQHGFIFLGAATLLVGVAVSLFLMSGSSPEACGCYPDGEFRPGNEPDGFRDTRQETVLRWSDLAGDSRFYVLAVAHGLPVMAFLTVMMHQVNYALDNGIERIAAASSLGAVSAFGILGQFSFGWLSDRMQDPKYAASIGYAVMAAGMVLLLQSTDARMLYLYAIVFGIGYGSLAPMLPVMVADRFGRHVMGSVYGLLTFFTVGVAGSAGPLLGGLIYDRTGSYQTVWLFNLAFLIMASVLILALRRGGAKRGGSGSSG
ncbi:MAG TPA: MFS transporter [Syntrophales bacterium]|nr:MFS transporter [Syntrophales bacterium]HPI58290.1 MFS transporter [Syntrophales bacterium]HPN26108.1 MFS transporter [Syntrophales bacterium]HQM30485.1 MFS transporter [Syntrophales bacterium]